MKHADLVERCAIAASGMSEAEFRVIDEGQLSHYRLAAYRALYEAFEALKEPSFKMLSAAQSAWLADTQRRTTTLYAAMLSASPLNPER